MQFYCQWDSVLSFKMEATNKEQDPAKLEALLADSAG
jgi:hypothetical protein